MPGLDLEPLKQKENKNEEKEGILSAKSNMNTNTYMRTCFLYVGMEHTKNNYRNEDGANSAVVAGACWEEQVALRHTMA